MLPELADDPHVRDLTFRPAVGENQLNPNRWFVQVRCSCGDFHWSSSPYTAQLEGARTQARMRHARHAANAYQKQRRDQPVIAGNGHQPVLGPSTTDFRRAELERAVAERERMAEEARQALLRLDSLPPEPEGDPSEGVAVWWEIAFGTGGRHRGRTFTYAAVKCGDGRWAVTGAVGTGRSSQTWSDLMAWIDREAAVFPEIWVVGEWQKL